jgi:nucleotide-binding universal stress UspA family protein
MLPCKTIVCGVDFSQASYEALKAANELADAFSAELLLVHVTHCVALSTDLAAAGGVGLQAYAREVVQEARATLQEVVAERVPDAIQTRQILREGEPGHEIIEVAEAEDANLIVIASHGTSGLHHYLHGSVAQRVIQHAPCAVLVIRCPRHMEYRRAQNPDG